MGVLADGLELTRFRGHGVSSGCAEFCAPANQFELSDRDYVGALRVGSKERDAGSDDEDDPDGETHEPERDPWTAVRERDGEGRCGEQACGTRHGDGANPAGDDVAGGGGLAESDEGDDPWRLFVRTERVQTLLGWTPVHNYASCVLPTVLTDAISSSQVLDPAGNRTPLHSNVLLEEAELLYSLVGRIAPEIAIEIGCAHGISTLAIAQGVAECGGTHHVIDPRQHRGYAGIGFANIERAGLSASVRCYEDFPENVVPGLPVASFAFIDASHLFDLSVLDFVLVDKRLAVGGIIGFHDMWMPSLRKLLRYILTNRDYEVVETNPVMSRRTQFLLDMQRASRARTPTPGQSLSEMGIRDNLAFVRKVADDSRGWTFHRDF